MFKKLFFKAIDEEEEREKEIHENIDPVVEQRRKEKFSTPFIYDEEDEIKEEPKKKEKKLDKPKKEEKKETIPYQMSQIISPTMGVKKSKVEETKKTTNNIKKPKKRKIEDQLVPVFSPFNGPKDFYVEEPPKPQKLTKAKKTRNEEKEVKTVEDNLRNIANIIEEEQDQLKIIEERTGEFKLDFSKQNNDTFIDEIDDNMSLDELMSLYEKKFKD